MTGVIPSDGARALLSRPAARPVVASFQGTAIHEAGHALAARLLGLPVTFVSVVDGGYSTRFAGFTWAPA